MANIAAIRASRKSAPVTFSHVVTGDIGKWKGGQVLTIESEIAEYLRTVANEGRREAISLNNDQIMAIAKNIKAKEKELGLDPESAEYSDDLEVLTVEAIEAAQPRVLEAKAVSVKQVAGVTPSGDRIMLARTLAEISSHDACFEEDVTEIFKANETMKQASIKLLWDLKRIHGDEGLREYPIVNSTIETRPEGSNVPIDIVKVNQKGKSIEQSFFDLWAEAHSIGAALVSEITEYKKAKRTNTQEPSGRYKGLSQLEVGSAIDAHDQDLRKFKNTVRQAFAVFQHIDRINNELGDECAASIRTIGAKVKEDPRAIDGRVLPPRTYDLVVVKDKKGTDSWTFPATGFLRLDVDKALKDGGTFQALMDTTLRGADSDAEDNGDYKIENILEWHRAVGPLSRYISTLIDTAGGMAQFNKDLEKACAKKTRDEAYVQALWDMSEFFAEVRDTIAPTIQAIAKEHSQAE